MIRALSGCRPDRIEEVLSWTVRDGLEAYVACLRERAREDYRTELFLWAILAPWRKEPSDPPQPPAILSGEL